MVYTFKALRDQVLKWIDELGESTTEDIVKEVMNQSHSQRCTEKSWNFMLYPVAQTFTTVAGQRLYTLHQEFNRPLYFYNRTQKKFLTEHPSYQLVEHPDPILADSTTYPDQFIFHGETPFKQNLLAASTVSVVSNSASDTGANYTVVVKGETADGDVQIETVTLNGTTPVATTTSFVHVLAASKSRTFNGTLSLKDSAANVILTLFPDEMGKTYRQIYLLDSPQAGDVIEYKFYHQPLILTNDYDIPDVPGPYSQILVWDTLILLAGGYLTSTTNVSLEAWRNMQRSWEYNLYSYEMKGQTIGSVAEFFKDLRGE